MRKISIILCLIALSGCATNRAYLPHIPKNVKLTNLEVTTNSVLGGSIVVKVESYESVGDPE